MKKTKKMILLANFLAIAIVLNIIESMIPIIPVPGAKLGFANVVTLVVLYAYSFRDTSWLTLTRVLLVSLLTGKLLGPVFYMSMSGAVFAVLAMGIVKKTKFFGVLGVSVIGSVFHCIGQIVGGYFVISSAAIVLYLPVMLFLSIPAGVVTGLIAQRFLSVWRTWQTATE